MVRFVMISHCLLKKQLVYMLDTRCTYISTELPQGILGNYLHVIVSVSLASITSWSLLLRVGGVIENPATRPGGKKKRGFYKLHVHCFGHYVKTSAHQLVP